MSVHLGIDVGAVSAKVAVVVSADARGIVGTRDVGGLLSCVNAGGDNGDVAIYCTAAQRTRGQPLATVDRLLHQILNQLNGAEVVSAGVTGSGGHLLADVLGAPVCNEFQAVARAMSRLYPQIRTVFELGGESSRYLRLAPDGENGALSIIDYSANGDCAAGTGAFLDQQATRLNFDVAEIGAVVAGADRSAQIAGRCSVFAKSDMIHAQQKGFAPPEVLAGLCHAVAANYKSAVVKGRPVETPVALLGGVAANAGVVAALRDVFELKEDDLFVPAHADALSAVGAALYAMQQDACDVAAGIARLDARVERPAPEFARARPLTLKRVRLLRDDVRQYEFPADGHPVDAWLGLDIGSVGTKLVLVDTAGEVIHSIFTRTEGRPIEVVGRSLHEMEEAVGWGVRVRGVGTTGSGRELIGELVGADSVNDEITAHKTGATFIGQRLLGRRPDTIFEIGGQDSKYIRVEEEGTEARRHGGTKGGAVVVDFTMNEACAAGTGSFLEERAEELGVSIKREFAQLALSSSAPIKLGERCTVFMERDVNTCMQRGAERVDVIAGLAYSVAYNYINRVVRGRSIGDCVFFQGGTAYNDAVAAAFSIIIDKEVIVPPYNAVMGAIGAALLARDRIRSTGSSTRFRGYDLSGVDYALREFECHGCGNECSIQEFDVAGEKTFWGDKCSDRFRKRAKSERKPDIPDLVALRNELLHADDDGDSLDATITIGIPLAMYTWDFLPLWRTFFRGCGLRVKVSSETNRRVARLGMDSVVAEPCFPIIVAHGHVAELVEQGVDYIWLPNLLAGTEKQGDLNSYVCPWGSTLPFVVRQAPPFRNWRGRILCPRLSFQEGLDAVKRELVRTAADLGVKKSVARRAFDEGMAAQDMFRARYRAAGREALDQLIKFGAPGMVLAGRPYNIHDAGVSLSVARKLREQYGVNVLPIDCLPLDDIEIADVADNMYWSYGRRIVAAGKLVARHENLHIIYVTNFKCGPDSFIKGFMRPASGKPFLTLQFDGHSNDAGMMTRCEAYLDSKGILRWWRTCKSSGVAECSPDERSISPKWPTPQPG